MILPVSASGRVPVRAVPLSAGGGCLLRTVSPSLSWRGASAELVEICLSHKPNRRLIVLAVRPFNQGVFNQNYLDV